MRPHAVALCALLVVGGGAVAGAAEPRLDPRQPILCLDDERGVPSHVQCDTAATGPGVCWIAPMCKEKLPRGETTQCTPLDRLATCTYSEQPPTLLDILATHQMVPALADVEEGWWRDDDGRVFQVAFDLNRRFWLGARWVGAWGDERTAAKGFGLDMGFRLDVFEGDLRTRTRFHFLESDVTLGPLTFRGSLLRFDTSNDGDEPFLRVTTFIGEPERHDVYVTAGWWGDLLGIEYRPRGSEGDAFLRIVGAGLTWDLWHDADMSSFLRLRAGLALDDLFHDKEARLALTPLVYLESDVTFDADGFHRLLLGWGYEAVLFDGPSEGGADRFDRVLGEVAYELVLIALNDQPLTLRVGVSGGYRNDVTDGALHGWEVAASAGLRLSLWAPAPDFALRRQAEARRLERDP